MKKNEITALMKDPYRNSLWLIVNVSAEKSGLPKMAAISGVRMSATKAVITAPKAAPMTTATARSTTLPRMMKSRNPLNIRPPLVESRRVRRIFRMSLPPGAQRR